MKKYLFGVMTLVMVTLVAVPLSVRATMTTLGTYATSNTVSHVQIVGSYAYISEQSTGLKILDISSPAAPALAGTYALTNISSFTIVGTKAYVVGGSTLSVLDLTTPTAPALLGSYTDLTYYVGRVTSDGTYAYLSGYVRSPSFEYQVRAVNVSNPAAPAWVKTLAVSSLADITMAGSYVYVIGDHTFTVVNVYPGLAVVGSFTDPAGGLMQPYYLGVQVSGTAAYINDTTHGLHIISVANPAAPSLLANSDGRYGQGLAVSSGRVYLSNYFDGGVTVFNITTPTNPVLLGSATGTGNAMDVAVTGNTAVVVGTTGVRLFDVANPTLPVTPSNTPAGSSPTPGSVPSITNGAPTLTLKGSSLIVLAPGAKYTEPGYTATDATDGVLTASVIRTGTVNTAKVGIYLLTYTVTDSGGLKTTVTRTVVITPTVSPIAFANRTFTLTVGKKKVRIQPFPSYRGTVIARKIVVNTNADPYYLFIPTDALKKPEIAYYNSQGKLVKRVNVASVSTSGLNLQLAANPASASLFIGLAAKANSLSVTTYSLNAKGITGLGTIKTVAGKGTLVFHLLKAYTQEFALVTMTKNDTKNAPKVWRYNPFTKKFAQDKYYPAVFLKWTKTDVKLK